MPLFEYVCIECGSADEHLGPHTSTGSRPLHRVRCRGEPPGAAAGALDGGLRPRVIIGRHLSAALGIVNATSV
jgi:hypothetical protein